MFSLLFDEVHQGLFYHIGKRAILFLRDPLQAIAKPVGAFFREVDV